MRDIVASFNKKLAEEISISRQMGIQVAGFDGASVTLQAPLGINTNDKDTAFAGSVYSLCVLSGWSLLSLILDQVRMSAGVVVYDSTIRYLKPVTRDFSARSSSLATETIDQFVAALGRDGKARTVVSVAITEGAHTVVEFVGHYAALLTDSASRAG